MIWSCHLINPYLGTAGFFGSTENIFLVTLRLSRTPLPLVDASCPQTCILLQCPLVVMELGWVLEDYRAILSRVILVALGLFLNGLVVSYRTSERVRHLVNTEGLICFALDFFIHILNYHSL